MKSQPSSQVGTQAVERTYVSITQSINNDAKKGTYRRITTLFLGSYTDR
jgi:hypothetical protein